MNEIVENSSDPNRKEAHQKFKNAAKWGCWLLSSARRGGREAGVSEWGKEEKLVRRERAIQTR
jgi:hypothetical protein